MLRSEWRKLMNSDSIGDRYLVHGERIDKHKRQLTRICSPISLNKCLRIEQPFGDQSLTFCLELVYLHTTNNRLGLAIISQAGKGLEMGEAIRWVKTHCARMDHGGCGLLVGIEDNRIVKVKGDPDGFLNKGYICSKGIASPDRLTHPDRLKHPLKRVGRRGEGNWKRISWQVALEEIAENLLTIKEHYGAKAVAFGAGTPKGLEHFVLIRLANIFGSPNVVAPQDVCHAPREVTGMHTCGFYPVADLHHSSKLILLWASNITSTNEEGEICSMLLEQVRKGTDLIVIDPRKIDLVKKAKNWLQLRPGTDHALALGLLHVIIEETLYDTAFVENWTHGFNDLADHVKRFINQHYDISEKELAEGLPEGIGEKMKAEFTEWYQKETTF